MARNPTTWTQHIDEPSMYPTRNVLATAPDNLFDDMEYTLDAEQMLISDCFYRQKITDHTSYENIRRYISQFKDMCDEAGISNNEISAKWAVYAKAENQTGTVRITTDATTTTTDTLNVTAGSGWDWWGFGDIDVNTNNNLTDVLFSGTTAASGGILWVGGVALYASET